MRLATCSLLTAAALALACQQAANPPSMRSLARSGALSVVCRDMVSGLGLDINGCPDPQATKTTGRHTMLLVTQKERGEIAIIDMTNKSVIDEDPAAPGTEFLPIGAMPESIVSTPGGVATFVATAQPGREALFVLPTSCIMPPKSGEPARDLTQWSACRLPGPPGEMVLVPDRSEDSTGTYRKSCADPSNPAVADTVRADCPADWDAEERIKPFGRRKILLTLPTKGGVAIIDARSLYGLQPGSFEACPIERWVPLSSNVPTNLVQALPPELENANAACSITNNYDLPTLTAPKSQPAGIAFKDGHLYVADMGVPLVHELDLNDPCAPQELPPLVPTSIEDPKRAVLTSDVAVSDLTRKQQRFVYAVDDKLGNLMAFDVGPTSSQRTPLVFPGLPYRPFDSPDRINTNINRASVKDLAFVTHDVPIVDQTSASSSTGVLCDPNPNADPASAQAQYRTSSDYSLGASPSKLRGTFAMVALSDGHVSVIDVEDWDAECRRPVEGSKAGETSWRGCACSNPDQCPAEFMVDDSRTVSDEASCNVFEPHSPRSARFITTNSSVGTGAPSLPTFPALTTPSGEAGTSNSSRTTSAPKLLAVPYPTVKGTSEVNIGSTRYYLTPGAREPNGATRLDTDPATATHHSVLLPQIEPRSYLPSENFSLTYEGKLFDDRESGLLGTDLSIADPDANFCDQGVQDNDVTASVSNLYLAAGGDTNAFVAAHADFVQITQDFTDTDPYWPTALGSSCAADPATAVSGINGCRSYFGTKDNFKPTRELTVVEAYQDRLVLRPRSSDPAVWENLQCCFPGTVKYTVRAGHQWVFRGQQALSRVTANSSKRCQLDCSPRKTYVTNRAIEIASTDTSCPKDSVNCTCTQGSECIVGIGPVRDYSACTVNDNAFVDPNSSALPSGCIFDSLKARFAVYSGTAPSVRDMAFNWQVTGGFVPYRVTLANNYTGAAVMPESMTLAPNINAFFVVDGVSGGVFEFVLDPFTLNGNPYL